MEQIFVYILISLGAALPIRTLLDFLTPTQRIPDKDSDNIKSKFSLAKSNILIFTSQIIKFILGYSLCSLAYTYFFYNNEVFFILAVLLILASYCWPIFDRFKKNKDIFLFLIGIYCVFNPQFIWIFPVTLFIIILIIVTVTTFIIATPTKTRAGRNKSTLSQRIVQQTLLES